MINIISFLLRPNDGFIEQLQLYEAMENTVDKANPIYKQYRLQLLATQIQSTGRLIFWDIF